MRRLVFPFLVTFAALAAAACVERVSAPGEPGLRVIAAPSVNDTVDAYPQQLLVLELRDQRGLPVAGAELVFSSLVDEETPARVSSVYPARQTDADGRVTTRVQFGTMTGPARLLVEVPELDLGLTLSYLVHAGRTVQLVAPAQGMTLGDTISPVVRALDRHGNVTGQPATLSDARAPLALTDDRRLYATDHGRATVRVQVLDQVDSVLVTVVPRGWLAGYAVAGLDTLPTGIHRLTLDGRTGALVAAATLGMPMPHGIDWSPDGMFLAYGDTPSSRIVLVNTVTGATAPLSGTDAFTRAHSPRFAADGASLFFWGADPGGEGIWRAPLGGGAPLLLAPDAPASAHISADGARLTYELDGRIVVQDVATGMIADQGVSGTTPRFSPDGRRIAFFDAAGELAVLTTGTGALRTAVLEGVPYTIDWSPLGAWLLVGGSTGVQLVELATLRVLPVPHHLFFPAFRFVEETAPAID